MIEIHKSLEDVRESEVISDQRLRCHFECGKNERKNHPAICSELAGRFYCVNSCAR